MNILITLSFLVLTLIGISHCQYRMRNMQPIHSGPRDLSYGCTCEELTSLIALVRALEEKECETAPVQNGNFFNVEELIMKLVNALIHITSQALSQKHCNCDNTGGNNNPPNNNGGTSYPHPGGGLIDLDLLNPNKKDNVLDLDLARQHLLGVGLGGGGSSGSNGYNQGNQDSNSNGRNTNGDKTDEGLINLDLLNPNKKNNVADVDLVRQHILGVGLGGGGDSATSQTAPVNSNNDDATKSGNNGGANNGPNSNEGIINLDVLNPNKQNNVAELDLAKQTVLGVGLGDRKDGIV